MLNENESINALYNPSIQNTLDQYQIQLNYSLDIIYFTIQNNYNIYESFYTLDYLQKKLNSNYTIEKMIKFINGLITQKNIKIEENENNLKLILLDGNVELIIYKKKIISYELIEKLNKRIELIENKNEELNKTIELIKNKNEELNNKNEELNKRIKVIENKNEELNNKNEELNKRIKVIENKNEELNNKNEEYQDKNKTTLTKCILQNINYIQPHQDRINSLSSFPSGNIISVSADKSIIIYDIHLNILQNIQNAHNKAIAYVEVKDDNNFITCSYDRSIKLWIKKENQFQINKIINNAHNDRIIKVIYCSNGNLISCSDDYKIKIWKENNNNNYDNIQIFTHSKEVYSILLLEDKNILISSGNDGTKFWDLNEINNIKCIKYFEDTFCGWHGSLCRLDEDRIIVQDKETNSLKVISILNLKIIKEINNPFQCAGITLIENKGIFIVGGKSKDIRIYRNDNYECIQTIQNAHDDNILGFIELKDCSIASFSKDKTIKIWCF